MSSNYLASIPKLKRRENFDDWAFAVENLLILEGAEKYLKEEGTEAATVAADAKARAKLILTIDSSLFVHIKETKTSNQLWTKLRALFDDSGFSRRITLLRGSTSKHGGPTSMSNSSNVKNTKTITCYRCKKMGHYRNQCPLLNEKTESKNESNAFSVVFFSGKFSKSDFYIDSGASMHMTANESWIKNPTYSSRLPQIIIANKTKAISGPEKQQWLQAMAEELQSFKDNKAWEIIDAPDNASVVQCKWVLRKTYNCDY
ncbi:Retrovirus-related Pol polyprotein from transposon TNT 1-94, partial [Operophtera brumata]